MSRPTRNAGRAGRLQGMGFFERNRAVPGRAGDRPGPAAAGPVLHRAVPGAARRRRAHLRTGPVRLVADGRRAGGGAADLLLDRAARAAGHRDRHRHPLRHQVVEVRHHVEGRAVPRPARRVRRRARSAAAYVVETAEHGYTTNVPLADLLGDNVLVAYEYDHAPIEPEHGGPVRLVVPHLYFWKSAKWLAVDRAARPRPARLLGAERLPRVRRPVPRAALQLTP